MTAEELAQFMVGILRDDESYDAPYIDAEDLTQVMVDGIVDFVQLARLIQEKLS